ncbi:MAG: rRNA maturation RNase YbeY [Nitrospirota bacterium]|nr:rRNA maturation RNase YbeY [Nitrospirota bacterium]
MEKHLTEALRYLHLQSSELSVLFVNSRRMKLLNTRYRKISKDTDVLSFPLMDRDLYHRPVILGDIVISVPRALKQAEEFGVPFYDELLRLLIHGLLHLVGYDHEVNAYQKKKMEKKERELFDAVKKVD